MLRMHRKEWETDHIWLGGGKNLGGLPGGGGIRPQAQR